MKCPLDQTELLITERQGVEIDYCPTCRGVWLDRGELDKLIERADAYDNRDRSQSDSRNDNRGEFNRGEFNRGEQPYQAPYQGSPPRPPGQSSSPDIAGMVGDVLKKKFDERKRDDYKRDDYDRDRNYGHKKKKGGLLGDLFDF